MSVFSIAEININTDPPSVMKGRVRQNIKPEGAFIIKLIKSGSKTGMEIKDPAAVSVARLKKACCFCASRVAIFHSGTMYDIKTIRIKKARMEEINTR